MMLRIVPFVMACFMIVVVYLALQVWQPWSESTELIKTTQRLSNYTLVDSKAPEPTLPEAPQADLTGIQMLEETMPEGFSLLLDDPLTRDYFVKILRGPRVQELMRRYHALDVEKIEEFPDFEVWMQGKVFVPAISSNEIQNIDSRIAELQVSEQGTSDSGQERELKKLLSQREELMAEEIKPNVDLLAHKMKAMDEYSKVMDAYYETQDVKNEQHRQLMQELTDAMREESGLKFEDAESSPVE